jgi:ribulose kinase
VKSLIEQIDVHACIEHDLFLHVLELLKIKCSGIFHCCLCNLKNRIKANITGKPIVTMNCPVAASSGTAVLQACATATYPDTETAANRMVQVASTIILDPEQVSVYKSTYQEFMSVGHKYFKSRGGV